MKLVASGSNVKAILKRFGITKRHDAYINWCQRGCPCGNAGVVLYRGITDDGIIFFIDAYNQSCTSGVA